MILKRLALFSLVLMFFASCADDKAAKTNETYNVNFKVNGKELLTEGADYAPQEFDESNPEHVLVVGVGQKITFEDISKPQTYQQVVFELAGDEKIIKKEEKKNLRFEHQFSTPGLKEITLKIGRYSFATKWVLVVEDDNMAYSNQIEVVEEDLTTSPNNGYTAPDLPSNNDSKGNTNADNSFKRQNTSSTSSTNTNITDTRKDETVASIRKDTKPVKIVKVEDVVIDAPGSVMVGDKVNFYDKSYPAEAVKNRQWDFGDGTVRSSSGPHYTHYYRTPATYIVKLCVNYNEKCESKTINVKPKPEEKKPPLADNTRNQSTGGNTTTKPVEKPKPKPTVSTVDFNFPSEKIFVGDRVVFEDKSEPRSAVESRKWSIKGSSFTAVTSKPSTLFDKAGTYEIELCVNGDKCKTHTITVEEKAAPKPVNQPTGEATKFLGEEASAGIRSGLKCRGADLNYFSGKTHINITPKRTIEMETAKLFANTAGEVRITLTDQSNNILGSFVSTVNPGPAATLIPLYEFGEELFAGNTYTLIFETMDQGLTLEDSVKCNGGVSTSSGQVNLKYYNQIILYDFRFVY